MRYDLTLDNSPEHALERRIRVMKTEKQIQIVLNYILKVWLNSWQITENFNLKREPEQYVKNVTSWRSDILFGVIWFVCALVSQVSTIKIWWQTGFSGKFQDVMYFYLNTGLSLLFFSVAIYFFITAWNNIPHKIIRKFVKEYSAIQKKIVAANLALSIVDVLPHASGGNQEYFLTNLSTCENQGATAFGNVWSRMVILCLRRLGTQISELESRFKWGEAKAKKNKEFIPMYKVALELQLIHDTGYGEYIPKPEF